MFFGLGDEVLGELVFCCHGVIFSCWGWEGLHRFPDSPRKWHKQAEIDNGTQPGITTDMAAENRRLRKEIAELKRTNEILRTASAFFAAELDHPAR